MTASDRKLLDEILEVSQRLLGEDSDGYCKDPATLPADVQAELREAAKLLFPLLQRIADEVE